jgi:5-formyltetrahydrofolate cyclo-ligase
VAAGLEQAVGLGGILPAAGAAVAAFEATPSEPPTAELLALLAGRGLRVLVPASGPERRTLAWTEIAPVTCALPVPGFEPTGAAVGPEALGECELVLVPALAVDRSGVRLGQGGGWYDRALRFADGGALRLAVCFADEVFAAGTLPAEPHDVLVHGALTAAGVELFD